MRSEFTITSTKQCTLPKYLKSGPEIVWLVARISILRFVPVCNLISDRRIYTLVLIFCIRCSTLALSLRP